MLYNLQEQKSGGMLPLGNIYLPIFTAFLPKDYADELEKGYLAKKNVWVMQEQRQEGDIFAEIRKKSAENFMRDKQYLGLKKKNEKITYLTQKMGSEWTTKEVEDVYHITKLLEQGINLDK